MSAAPEIVKFLADELGVPRSTIDTIVRRLGEAGALPRGGRGRPPADLDAGHVACILVGVLSVGDGISGAATRVVQAVEAIGAQHCDTTVRFSQGDSLAAREYLPKLVGKVGFREALTYLIESARDPEFAINCKKVLSAVGVSFGGDNVFAWLDLESGSRDFWVDGPVWTTTALDGATRVVFGEFEPEGWSGMTREVRIDADTLLRLAAKLASGDRVSLKVQSRRPRLEDG